MHHYLRQLDQQLRPERQPKTQQPPHNTTHFASEMLDPVSRDRRRRGSQPISLCLKNSLASMAHGSGFSSLRPRCAALMLDRFTLRSCPLALSFTMMQSPLTISNTVPPNLSLSFVPAPATRVRGTKQQHTSQNLHCHKTTATKPLQCYGLTWLLHGCA